jgi:hypothetical protein
VAKASPIILRLMRAFSMLPQFSWPVVQTAMFFSCAKLGRETNTSSKPSWRFSSFAAERHVIRQVE